MRLTVGALVAVYMIMYLVDELVFLM